MHLGTRLTRMTMQPLPDFESAKSSLAPDEYKRLLNSLTFSDLTLETVNTEVNRSALVELDNLQFDIERFARLRQNDANHPELLLDYSVKALANNQVFTTINVTYCLAFETHEETPIEFFSIYDRMSSDMQAWPFLREMVNSLTSLMGIPRLFLPILTDTASIRRSSSTVTG